MAPLVIRVFSDYLCPWCYVAAVRLQRLQEEYQGKISLRWQSFLLFREDSHKGWNSYIAAHWHKAQEAEPSLVFTPWQGSSYPSTSLPAHIVGKAVSRQGQALFDAFHLEAMRAFFSRSQNIADPAVLRQIAAGVGADLGLLDEALADPGLKERVWQEFMLGVEEDRVQAVPTLFVGKRVVEGALPLERYRKLFDEALAQA